MKKVIDLKSVSIGSINDKFSLNKKTGRLFLNKKYKNFKNLLLLSCQHAELEKPYRVDIYLKSYADIDNPIKCILDSLKCLENDRYIEELHIYKQPIKKRQLGEIKVFVGTINNGSTNEIHTEKDCNRTKNAKGAEIQRAACQGGET